jgi:Flp pilus assembly protein protease CpaA
MRQRALFFLFLLSTLTASAYDARIDSIYYNLIDSTKSAEVTRGEEFYAGSVTIPETVTYQDVTYTVTAIGGSAFAYSADLTSVTIPNTVTEIGGLAFMQCTGLTSITIPNSVETIGSHAFYVCENLTSITIPSSVKSIKNTSFSGCPALTSISVESRNTVYDSRENCNAIIETATNTIISGCMNTVIPNSVTAIGGSAFENCTGLKSLTIPNSVKSIGRLAFNFCTGLTSVTIPNSVTSIGIEVFEGCNALAAISVESGNTVYDSRENCNAVIETETNTLVAGCKNTVIPSSVTTIGKYAFAYCYGLTSMTIPEGVTTIDDQAFRTCMNMTSVTIPNSVTLIATFAFAYCDNLNSVTIGNSVDSIGDGAFGICPNLKDVYCYADSVPTGKYAFYRSSLNATLHVPAASVEAYKETYPWSGFGSIVALTDEETAVKGVKSTQQNVDGLPDCKYVKNGKLFIIKAGKKYNAVGRRCL